MDNHADREALADLLEGPYDFEVLISELADGAHQEDMYRVHGDKATPIQKLAQALRQTPPPKTDKPPVLIVPGNMCTEIVKPSGSSIWFDPEHLLFEWESLALSPEGPNLVPGDLLFLVKLYLIPVALQLMQNGYSVHYFPNDWRVDYVEGNRPLQHLLSELSKSRRKINMITHSEGGLIIRGAMGALGDRVYDSLNKLILVASPNYGAWAMMEMFQGQFLRTFNYMLPHHLDDIKELLEHHRLTRTPEYVAKRITGDIHSEPVRFFQWCRERIDNAVEAFCHPLFNDLYQFKDQFFLRFLESDITKKLIFTWPGWYGMLPFRDKASPLDMLYDASRWPSRFPRPKQALLDRALQVQRQLAMPPAPGQPGHGSWHLLMGTAVETVTRVRLATHKFEFDYTRQGDGLIPVDLSMMDHTTSETFKGLNHVELMLDEQVIQTMITILEGA